MTTKVHLPHLFVTNQTIAGNLIQQINQPSYSFEANLADYTHEKIKGKILISNGEDPLLLVHKKDHIIDSHSRIILVNQKQTKENNPILDLTNNLWLKHPQLQQAEINFDERFAATVATWENGFSFLQEDEPKDIKGLREPQLGALHAVHAHWAVTDDPATIVMPTGTGKTETMISVFISANCRRVLIIVPTDALRTQIAEKFLTFGVLKRFGVISSSCCYPVVGNLKHKLQTPAEVDNFFSKCNVIVTTINIAGQAKKEVQERMAYHCSALFIDEAHHVGAKTWKGLKKIFAAKRILQFTATPYREDDEPVGGKFIFKYPLQRAQEKKFFTKINFKPVRVYAKKKRDRAIAELAVAQLREDLEIREDGKTYNHILMARVNSIPRAKHVFSIYKTYEEFQPVLIHSEISKKDRDEAKRKLLTGESKIVVCVDMLGEGYDLPELKIAAFHDIRKSPAVTIQLAGRFTRTRSDLGDATFIANVGDQVVRSELKKLYTRDPDWNFLLPKLSEELINEQLDLNEFAEGFNKFPKEIPIQTLCPALSTVIYKTKCAEWMPENFLQGLVGADSFDRMFHDINSDNNTLIIVTAKKVQVEWTKVEGVFNWDWNLYVVYWDREQNLLFINNSSNSGNFQKLAQAVAGMNAELINGDVLFRCLGHITRITFKNVGLSEYGMISYTGRMGSNVEPALDELARQRAIKSVLMGTGFENGQRTSIGCSAKGRIWSHSRSYHLNKLIEWCSHTGKKVLDDTIDPDEFIKNTLVTKFVAARPPQMPFGIDWNEDIYLAPETAITFKFDETEESERLLYEVDINLVEPTKDGELRFEVESEGLKSQFTLTLCNEEDVAKYIVTNNAEKKLMVEWGARSISAEEFFYEYPPTIWFVDGSVLRGCRYTWPMRRSTPYPKEKIDGWDWPDDIDIKKESQYKDSEYTQKRTDSIQHHVIKKLQERDFDIVFDDDASGEAADIITIKVDDDRRVLNVEFYHCKYSTKEYPGARVDDLYAVCGQAQKSIRWMITPTELFQHLLRREEKRLDEHDTTRIERGDYDLIDEIVEKSSVYKTELKIFLVQPGLSKPDVSLDQLELLSVTDSFLKGTYMIPFGVIGNAK